MTKKIIALYDSNEDFICRLCSGFQLHSFFRVSPLYFSRKTSYVSF